MVVTPCIPLVLATMLMIPSTLYFSFDSVSRVGNSDLRGLLAPDSLTEPSVDTMSLLVMNTLRPPELSLRLACGEFIEGLGSLCRGREAIEAVCCPRATRSRESFLGIACAPEACSVGLVFRRKRPDKPTCSGTLLLGSLDFWLANATRASSIDEGLFLLLMTLSALDIYPDRF